VTWIGWAFTVTRRVVERTHSWLNRSRRLLVRWEKKVENYAAFLHLACTQLMFAKVFLVFFIDALGISKEDQEALWLVEGSAQF